jgi:hypothetical protein
MAVDFAEVVDFAEAVDPAAAAVFAVEVAVEAAAVAGSRKPSLQFAELSRDGVPKGDYDLRRGTGGL